MESAAAEELSECARYGEEEEIKQVRAHLRRRLHAAPAVAAPPAKAEPGPHSSKRILQRGRCRLPLTLNLPETALGQRCCWYTYTPFYIGSM